MGEGHADVLALRSRGPVTVDFPSTPGLPFVQLLVMTLLIQEGAGVWTALSWQLLSGLHLVTQGEESPLVLTWLMDWEGCVLGGSRMVASWLGQLLLDSEAGCGRERLYEEEA